MGGTGSTRWFHHRKKLAVEDVLKLPLKVFKSVLRVGPMCGILSWQRGEQITGKIIYWVEFTPTGNPQALHFAYSITESSEEARRADYVVGLTTSVLPWGRTRFWFLCPAAECGRRVSVLYKIPGKDWFVCRHCSNLSYRTRQDGYSDHILFAHLANLMQENFPGITEKDLKTILKR